MKATAGIIFLYSMKNFSTIENIYLKDELRPTTIKRAMANASSELFEVKMIDQNNNVEYIYIKLEDLVDSLVDHPSFTCKVSTKHIMK